MKSNLFVLAGVCSLCFGSAALSREADLLDFSQASAAGFDAVSDQGVSRSAALGDNPFRAAGAISGDVADMMRADFVSRGFDRADMAGGSVAIGEGLALPPITGGGIQPSLPSFTGSSSGSFEFCEGSRYQPTWWLHRTVEVRRERYYDIMASIACEYGIPTALLDAVISQESGYKSWAVSHAGAMGMMQIMPGTARYLGLAVPFDAVSNMRAGARYLKEQLDRFGRVDLALAAYNAGPHRRSLAAGYIPRIPETLNYVRTISTNWNRLSSFENFAAGGIDRGAVAVAAVRASGYRSVELVRYDGLNSPNPI